MNHKHLSKRVGSTKLGREGELLFDRDEGMVKITVGGEEVWYIYHPRHSQNGQVRQTPEPPH
jgi:hypothetical protein